MKRAMSILVVLAAAAVLLADGLRVDLRANLTGPGRAKGHAEWKTRDEGRRSEAELEVEGEKLARNAPLVVMVGSAAFPAMTDAFGSFEIEMNFGTTNRPTIAAGTPVAVLDAAGNLVLSGTF